MIIAVRKNGVLSIGGDLFASASILQKMPQEYVRNSEKIFKIGASFLGTDDNEAVSCAMQLFFSKRKPLFKNEAEIFTEFMALHRTLKEDYFLQAPSKSEGPFEPLGFHTLIANQYGLFGSFSSHDVIEYSRFYAIGRGCDYALGALEALYEKEKSSENLVRISLEIVAQFEIEAGPPGKIYSLQLK